ncbi:telomere repeat-binding protein 2 [Canna indica]|uniref:Telomere repeat-binding protein 2 n=1 Tax=Canna indica TaxID=4628 RepID=A0AAQ3KE16_9LILI|nr:telomere repeat-binding protein 2 [Canna indica]
MAFFSDSKEAMGRLSISHSLLPLPSPLNPSAVLRRQRFAPSALHGISCRSELALSFKNHLIPHPAKERNLKIRTPKKPTERSLRWTSRLRGKERVKGIRAGFNPKMLLALFCSEPLDMVSQTRLDYGSSGYEAPVVLHVRRSARGKRSARRKVEDNQMSAFDLLATVAGKLLLESENSLAKYHNCETSHTVVRTNVVKREQTEEEKSFEAFDRLSCNEDPLVPDNVLKKPSMHTFEEHSKEMSSELPFIFVKSEISHEDAIDADFTGNGSRKEVFDAFAGKHSSKRPFSTYDESHRFKDESKRLNQDEQNAPCMYSSDDHMHLDAKPILVSSDGSAEVPPCSNNIPHNISFSKRNDSMDHAVYMDDDESSSRCTHPNIVTNKASRLQRISDRRIRKLLASKFWKLGTTKLQDDAEKKPILRGKRMSYTRQRTQRSSFKERKLVDHYSVSSCDQRTYIEDMPNLCENGGIKLERNDSHPILCGEMDASTFITGQKCYGSSDNHVKLSIKSFKVPELVIDIPESATVGSLKRTVMEAVTAILGDGLRVGILLHGKKVRNDNKTLHQAGISHGDKFDSLGFTLEPNPKQGPAPMKSFEDPHFLSLGCAPEPLARIPPTAHAIVDQQVSDAIPQPSSTFHESNHDSVHSPTDISSPEKTTNSLALIVVPPMNAEALSMVPLHNKPKRTEVAQRRVRRPFSVAEVEALVLAVEKLGSGRWRDVKLCAFENAKHRTYVDLKDKWKTLVHTAKISPQQRRGEPVPQELLDRVLTAHAYCRSIHVKIHTHTREKKKIAKASPRTLTLSSMAGQSDPHLSIFSAPEVEFLAEDETIEIVPNIRMESLHMICGDFGPFFPQIASKVPLWLAVALKKRGKCSIRAPEWMSVDKLTQVLEAERESPREFQPLPFHYIEISKLLFDQYDSFHVKSLIEDIRDVRFHKVETGLETISGRTHAVKLKNLSAMEVNLVRPFMIRALQAFYKHDSPQMIQQPDTSGSRRPQVVDRGPRLYHTG